MSVEKLDLAIANFIKAVAKVTNPHFVQCSVLQQANALLDNIISSLPVPVMLEDIALAPFQTLLIHRCERLHDLLECLPNFQLKLISDIPLLTSDEHRYWYCCLLQSTYQCFKSLRICKLLHVTLNYYYDLMNHASICLNQLQNKVGSVAMLLELLRILYTSLAHLPQEILEPSPLIDAIIPYFKHEHKDVCMSARNTAQFLISLVDEATKHVFLLSQECLYDLIDASGIEMPTSSLLRLLLAYGQLPSNRSLYLAEGVFLFATKIAFQSSRDIEKKLAYAVIKMLACHETNEEAKSIETNGENDPAHSQATPTSDIVVVNAVMADANKETDTKSLLNILPQLNEQFERFKAICLKRERDTDGREIFKCLKEMLLLIKDQVSLLPEEPSKDINVMLSNILLDLLDALTMTDENQYIRWGNFIMFNCWIIIKALSGKSANTVLPNSQVSQLINKVLIAIPMFIGRKDKNEIIMKSLLFCVELLEDILFGTISLTTLDDELLAIKNTLINSRVLSYDPLRVSTQIILSSLVTEDDHEIVLKDLIVDEKIMAESIQQFSQLEDLKSVLLVLQKFNALSVIPENRATFRQLKLLPILERFSDKYSSTDVESLAAKLICSLLSDPPNDQQEENEHTNLIEKFFSADPQEEKHSHSVYAGIKEMITATTDVMSSDVRSDDNIPQQILRHAECLYLVMTACSVEFHRVIYKSDEIVDISFLLKTTKLLMQLVDIYKDVPADSIILSTLERQITYISTKHLPELASISFKAMKDAHSDSLSGVSKLIFWMCLMGYLQDLHICIEQWSRMDINVKKVLIDYGAFHLLLNELHTAPTAKIITDELVYFILKSFYNVVLIPELAKRFRISITKKLLSCYMSSGDVGTRCLAKFSMSCMHMLLSKSEISQISIDSDEAEMMAKCLKGIDPFFGDHGNLVTTIENLSHSPNNWQVFVDVRIVHSLIELALSETGSSRDCVLGALLNMIPEPEIDSLKQQPFKKVFQVDNLSSPATLLLKTMPGFMELMNTLSVTECKAIHLLLSPLKETRFEDIKVLYGAKRYTDCWQFCSHLLSDDKIDSKLKNKVLLYQAKCMYHTYNHEIMERIEQSDTMPGFEYKNMMRIFCNNRIVGVIKILTKLKSLALKANPAEQSVCSNSSTSPINGLECYISLESEFYEHEADYMLDKALFDFLVYNTKEVRTCLLCHKATDNLIHSHYIPKSILQEFVKAIGLDPGASIFVLGPLADHPSYLHCNKSAAKATFSMLCKKCDGEVLSKDENLFKDNIFNTVYQRKCPGSQMLDCVITYGQYLYRFAVGLIFRNMAPLYSSICAEIGEFIQLHNFMQECRDVILAGTSTANLKIFMLFLPSVLPAYLPQVSMWEQYVQMDNSPYAAYKLLQLGEPMIPKKIYCVMVKIGVMIFVIPLDIGLEMELDNLCPFYQIQFSETQSVMLVPEDKERGSLIPEKLWWSLYGWGSKVVDTLMSVATSEKLPVELSGKLHSGLLARSILEGSSNSASAHPVVFNLLPPGFELNYDEHSIPPEKVIQVPEGHVILLHGHFRTSSGIKGYSILGRLETVNTQKVPEKPAIYSIMQWPYVLVYLEHSKKKYVLKTGFSVDERDHKIRDVLLGCPTSMKDSEHLRKLTEQIPDIIGGLLRSKGFRNLKSLIFWQESMKKHRTKDMFVPPLDTRCTNDRCNYCKMRCDVCLQPCLYHHKLETFPTLGPVRTCSEVCTKYLFSGKNEFAVVKDKTKLADFSLKGHTEILYGTFSSDDLDYIGLKTHIFVSVIQSNDEAEGVLSIPSGLKYVKLWHHSIYKPHCIEYIIDDDFNAIELLPFKDSVSVFSSGEEKEMMHQFHEILVCSGIVYQYFQNLPND